MMMMDEDRQDGMLMFEGKPQMMGVVSWRR